MGSWLIATLGGQPQVVTMTLDLLLARGETVEKVWVVFPGGNPRYKKAHKRLRGEFAQYAPYVERGITYHARPIDYPDGFPMEDIREAGDVDRSWQVIGALIGAGKEKGLRLHISLTGGRRALALMLFSASMLYCTLEDKVWHIYTPQSVLDKVKGGTILHVGAEEGVRLLEVPFAPWGAYFPGLRAILGLRPQEMLALRRHLPDEETSQRCAMVWEMLSPRQREVLRALVVHPTRKEASLALGLSLSTVDTHRENILAKCRLVWGEEERVTLRFVRDVFRKWLTARGDLGSR